MTSRLAPLSILCAIFASSQAVAEGCSDYPLSDGIAFESTDAGPKIMATSSQAVLFDDRQEVVLAMRAAEMLAKAQISKFLSETIQTNESLDEVVNTEMQIVGDEKTANRSVVRTQLLELRSQSEALIKGAIRLGDCYSEGDYVMVTVGIKPETVAGANVLGNSMSAQSDNSGSGGQSGGAEGGATDNADAPKSFSNTKRISDF